MDFLEAQAQIEAIRKTLDEAKAYSGLGPDDPSVVALEQIMIAKIAELEATRLETAKSADAVKPDPTKQTADSDLPPVSFIAESEPSRAPTAAQTRLGEKHK